MLGRIIYRYDEYKYLRNIISRDGGNATDIQAKLVTSSGRHRKQGLQQLDLLMLSDVFKPDFDVLSVVLHNCNSLL